MGIEGEPNHLLQATACRLWPEGQTSSIILVSLPSTVDNIHLKKNSSVLHLHPHQLPTNRRNTSQRRNQSGCCRSSGRTQMLIHLELEFLCQNHSHTENTGLLPRDTCPLWAPRPLQGVDGPPDQEQICHFYMENQLWVWWCKLLTKA